ncbi:MAG: hypothetical protein H6R15_1542 [Proteobacteria bacterium]|nr:hypothetical protein [Pseudomonadota bacterium]
MQQEIIHLQSAAPKKPLAGEACNGCGVCCALETCPVARLRFLQKKGPCPALRWSAEATLYRCGLLSAPGNYLPCLPKVAEALTSRLLARWIAAGKGCDCTAEPAN